MSSIRMQFICFNIASDDGVLRVAGFCPFCRLPHRHSHPFGGTMNRVPHCRNASQHPEYSLQIQSGRAPARLLKALDSPLGDLLIARDGLTTAQDGLWVDDAGVAYRIPTREQIRFTLATLKACGDRGVAQAFREEISRGETRIFMKRDGHAYWLTPAGKALRFKLTAALDACLRRHTGPLLPSEIGG